MKQFIWTIVKCLLFWLVFFFVGRTLFLIVYHSHLHGIAFVEILKCYPHALRLDISTACYLLVVPTILLVMKLCFKTQWLNRLLHATMLIELIVCSLVLLGEICVYGEWLTKLSYKILLYLRHPMEIIATATYGQLAGGVLTVILLVTAFFMLYKKFVFCNFSPVKKCYLKAPFTLIVCGALIVLGMRGGLDAIPITQSSAYFSRHDILNDASVNPSWNLAYSFLYFGDLDADKFHYMDDEQAEEIFANIRQCEKDTNINIINQQNVNIVIILLESWSADLVESLSGTAGIAENFGRLEQEGILFTRTYANGHRSQQAICSILSGFPSVPMYDITDNQDKYRHLPSLSQKLMDKGYHTSFYFGGNLDYGNIRSFLLHCHFDTIVEGKHINSKIPRGKLGIHDQYMFQLHHDALNRMQQPFFSILFTASSHSPYDQPKNTPEVAIECEETPYLNSAKYCDYWLGKYFDSVRNEPWYKNTPFILVGDHSHPTHIKKEYHFSAAYQHVPLLFVGEVIPQALRGKQIDQVCSHVDLAYSILQQLGINNHEFCWGKNIFNPYAPQFAFYEAWSGFGWIRPNAEYANFTHEYSFEYGIGDSTLFPLLNQEGQAYLQKLYKTYFEY